MNLTPIEADNVTVLPVKPRDNSTERVLTEVRSYACLHKRFVIDDQLQQVECRDCGEKLNPMFALVQLCRQENRYHELHARYQDEMQRLGERSKTKCRHCGQMTPISRA
jgi:ribosomal protein S27E